MLPIAPALWVLRAMLRHLRRIDEYQRLLQLEALATGFGAAMIASLTIGFVGVGGVATRSAGWIVYGVGMVSWGLVAFALAAVFATSIEAIFTPDEASLPIPATP